MALVAAMQAAAATPERGQLKRVGDRARRVRASSSGALPRIRSAPSRLAAGAVFPLFASLLGLLIAVGFLYVAVANVPLQDGAPPIGLRVFIGVIAVYPVVRRTRR